jgi:hypothetical protein
MEVSDQLHVPIALLLGKRPQVRTEQEARWTPGLVWRFRQIGPHLPGLPSATPLCIARTRHLYHVVVVLVEYGMGEKVLK